MIGCSHVSGLEVRPYTRRGPVWRYADQVQFRFASAKLVDSHCFPGLDQSDQFALTVSSTSLTADASTQTPSGWR
jgi:hypothetical protein